MSGVTPYYHNYKANYCSEKATKLLYHEYSKQFTSKTQKQKTL